MCFLHGEADFKPNDTFAGHVLNLFELDCTISVSLNVGDETTHADNHTLSWPVVRQPRDDNVQVTLTLRELLACF